MSSNIIGSVAPATGQTAATGIPPARSNGNTLAIVENGGTANIDTDITSNQVVQIRVYDGIVNQDVYDVEIKYLMLGNNGANGIYSMSSGTLVAENLIRLGFNYTPGLSPNPGNGYFDMSGGHVQTNELILGGEQDSYAEMNISGGTIITNRDLIVGQNTAMGNAIVNQTGGDITIADHLFIGYKDTNPFVNADGRGIYNMNGGTLFVGEDMCVGSKRINIYYDPLSEYDPAVASEGRLFFTGGRITVSGGLYVYHNDSYINDSAAPGGVGGTIDVWGDFRNYSEARLDFDLRHTTLILHGLAGWDGSEWYVSSLDMNSVDYGASVAGLDINFAIGNLVFSGAAGTSQWYRLESDIYCYGLLIEEGALIDLNGYNIYYMPQGTYSGISAGTVQLAGIWGNMEIFEYGDIFEIPAVPEPGTIMLIGSGLLGIASLVRKRFA